VEAITTKDNYKRADAVMAAKIDRMEKKARELTKRTEEARDASVRYRRERDEYKAELDRANKELDRAWAVCTGIANAPRGTDASNRTFVNMVNPLEEDRQDKACDNTKLWLGVVVGKDPSVGYETSGTVFGRVLWVFD
jgi:soluble cytochrome b562